MTGEPTRLDGAVTPDPVAVPADLTPARLGLGRAGAGLPTRAVLAFALAHAAARDAVHAPFAADALAARLAPLSPDVLHLESAAPDRASYLARPDLGRRLSRNSRSVLAARPRTGCDVAVVICDGLSATAVDTNAARLLEPLLGRLAALGRTVGPLVLVSQGRVAIGDEIGALSGARLSLVLVGERPGLSSADSLGAYLTFDPRLGRTDADRNCVSNIREAGLRPAEAATTIAWLIEAALGRGLTGVALKEESGGPSLIR